MQKAVTVNTELIFSILADRHSTNILKAAFSGMRASSTHYVSNK